MPKKKLIYTGTVEKIFPRIGVFKPGDEVDYNKSLLSTGLFREKQSKKVEKEDDE
jgi:hypothetical protein